MRRLTAAEQTAVHLREGIRAGRWLGRLPGVLALAAECDVSPATMRAAIRLLEEEGWIRSSGAGRPRTAGPPAEGRTIKRRTMRVMVLPGMRIQDEDAPFQQILMMLQRDLEAENHVCRFSATSQSEMLYNLERIKRHVIRNPADAWVVVGGNRETLTWFSEHKQPVIAIGGSCIGVPIASTGMDGTSGYHAAIRRLIELGHRRILFLWPRKGIDSGPSGLTLLLKEALGEAGTELTNYHVPVWNGTQDELYSVLENAFRFTPPTAILATYGNWMAGVLSFLAARGLQAPDDVSLFCLNDDVWFSWKRPEIARLRGDETRIVRRIVRWVNAAASGRADRKAINFPHNFVEGGTIGPLPQTAK